VADRPNLKVYLDSFVEKIVLDRDSSEEPQATGIQIVHNGNRTTIHAAKEVILSAGVFGSPKLLELSGIGDPEILRNHGIEAKVSNPYVGTNLQDHPMSAVSFEAADGIATIDNMIRKDPATLKMATDLYQNHRSGPFATSGVTSFAYLPTVDFIKSPGELEAALKMLSDATSFHPLDPVRFETLGRLLENGNEGTSQFYLMPVQFSPPGKDTTKPKEPISPKPENFISIFTAVAHPISTGTAHISSSDPSALPTVDLAYLNQPLDLELHARHLMYLETIAATPPFSSLLKPGGKRNDPATVLNGDLERAKALARSSVTSNWHYCGTCAMAPRDKGGVVDTSLRVYGVKGLRVVDASVFPFVPQSNLQTLVYAVAERASDIIKGGI
jgi:choline dehydrogenase-like flavoprotein